MRAMYQAERPSSHRAGWGTHAELLASSRALAWPGIAVEVFRARDVDAAPQYAEHIVSLQVGGPINLFQRRNGRALQRMMHPGDVIVTPLGEPKVLRHQEEGEIVKL